MPYQDEQNSKKIESLQKIEQDAIPNTPLQGQELKDRIIFLAGPHKTGSSSLQTISVHLSNINTVPWLICDPWSDPSHVKDFFKLDRAKHFAALVLALRGEEANELFVNPPVDKEEVKRLFRDDLA